MFRNIKAEILNSAFQKTAEINTDIQPFEKPMQFEDNVEIEITKRAFCEIVSQIDNQSYLRIGGKLYKIMKIKPYSDYLELWLYECERGTT